MATERACEKLVEKLKRMKASKKAQAALKDPTATPTWEQVIAAAFDGGEGLQGFLHVCELTEKGVALPAFTDIMYDVYGAAVCMVEVDVLTGETRVLEVLVMMDTGPVLNPAIDIGQVEGAFVMGLGQQLLEAVNFDPKTGKCMSDNTWTYKIPTMYDIPEKFQVELLDFEGKRDNNGWGVVFSLLGKLLPMPYRPEAKFKAIKRSSRAMGEPPLLTASSVHSAIRQAVAAARLPSNGGPDPSPCYNLPAPANPQSVAELCWNGSDSLVDVVSAEGSEGQVEHVVQTTEAALMFPPRAAKGGARQSEGEVHARA